MWTETRPPGRIISATRNVGERRDPCEMDPDRAAAPGQETD
jgi:hypothetical protein